MNSQESQRSSREPESREDLTRRSSGYLSRLRFPSSLLSQGLLIFAVALAVRVLIAVLKQSWGDLERAEMELEAISLAQTGVLGNPYSLPTGPSAHVCPGYAILLAGIFRLFGTGTGGEAVKVGLTCLISSCQYALLPKLGRALQLSPGIGLAAGLFGALVPLYPYIEIQGDFENHLTALLLVLLLLAAEFFLGKAWSLWEAAGMGFFAGVCILVSSTIAPVCVLTLGYLGFRQTRRPGARPLGVLLAFVAAALCVAPWAIRNEVQLGSPIMTRSNFGMEFFLANNDQALPLMDDNFRLYACCHPLMNVAQARKIQQIGEVAYNKGLLETTVKWVETHRARFVQLTMEHFWLTWVPVAPERAREFVFRLMTPLSLLGLFLIWKTRPQSALLLAGVLFIYPLPYYLLQVHLRYRYPTQFILLLTASAAVVAGWQMIRGRVMRRIVAV